MKDSCTLVRGNGALLLLDGSSNVFRSIHMEAEQPREWIVLVIYCFSVSNLLCNKGSGFSQHYSANRKC